MSRRHAEPSTVAALAARLRDAARLIELVASMDAGGDVATAAAATINESPPAASDGRPPASAVCPTVAPSRRLVAGGRVSNKSKRARIAAALRDDPALSNKEIAAATGTCADTVRRVRRQLDSPGGDEAEPSEDSQPPPARVRKRIPTPLASPLYNLPAALVDDMKPLDLRRKIDLKTAHALADTLTSEMCRELDELERNGGDKAKWLADIHTLINVAAGRCPVIADEIRRHEEQFAEQKASLHSRWSENHEAKANNFPNVPIVFEPLSVAHLDLVARNIIE